MSLNIDVINCSRIQFKTTYKIAILTGMNGRYKIFFDCGILHFVSIIINERMPQTDAHVNMI